MKTMQTKIGWPFGILLVTMLACSMFSRPATPLAATPAPTQEPESLGQQVTLANLPFREESDGPRFTLTAQIPSLQGSDDARVTAFNAHMNDLIQNEFQVFKAGLQDLVVPPDLEVGSYMEETYTLLTPAGNDIFSLKLVFDEYVSGAAHPFQYSLTVNYDLEQGRELALDELFLPGSDSLGIIAAYCKTELGTRMHYDPGDPFEEGSDPKPENYQRWNITPEGLLITFDLYQVAPYASGPQTVTVPYRALSAVIDPGGPLAQFTR